MGKLKSILLTLLALALIAAMGFLPYGITQIRDRQDRAQTHYADMESLKLRIGVSDSELSIPEKLSLVSNFGLSIDIPDGMSHLSEEDAIALAREALRSYEQFTMTESDFFDVTFCEPALQIGFQEKTVHCAVWTISLRYGYTADGEPAEDPEFPPSNVTITLDDETGKLLSIYFWSEFMMDNTSDFFTQYDINRLTEIYLAGLDGALNPEESEVTELDGNTIIYSWYDTVYGELHITVYCSSSSFYILSSPP